VPGYEKYGISAELVERVKMKMKDANVKHRVMADLQHVTKADLQNRETVRRLVGVCADALGEPIGERQTDSIVQFVVTQKIDPQNALHLIKLWHMFR